MQGLVGDIFSCEYVSEDFVLVNNCGEVIKNDSFDSSRPDGRADYMIIYATEGNGYCMAKGEKVPFNAGDIILWRPNEPLVFSFTGASRHYWLHFTGLEVENIINFANIPKNGHCTVGNSKQLSTLFRNIVLELQFNRPSTPIMCIGYFMQLMATIQNLLQGDNASVEGIYKSKILPAIKEITGNYADNKPLSYYASLCNLSTPHFKALFTKTVHMSPTAYIVQLKLAHIKNLLLTTDLAISEIARQMGFNDQMYLSRFFKKHTGMTPTEFRKSDNSVTPPKKSKIDDNFTTNDNPM